MAIVGMTVTTAWARKRRLVGTISAVLLGVAFLAATLVLGDTARAGFADVFGRANAGTDVVVRSESRLQGEGTVQQGLLDASLADTVNDVDGVDRAVPVVEGTAQVLGADGQPVGGDGPPTIGTGWIDDPQLNPFSLAEGRAPAADGEVVLALATAADAGLAIGDRATVLTPAPQSVRVVGLVAFGEDDGLAGATFVGFTPAQAATLLLGDPGAATSLYVAGEPGISQAALAGRIDDVLPDGTEAITGAARTAEQQGDIEEDFLGMMEAFLLTFAGIALLVAASSVHNTASILAAQRTRESALLRAVGASRRQVLTASLVEAALVGIVGAGLGALAGVGLARGIGALLDAADAGLPADDLVVTASALAWSIGIGVGLSLLASLAPAIKASRVPPVAAMRSSALEDGRASRGRIAVGVLASLTGAGAVAMAAESESALATAGLGALLLFAGAVLLGPVLAGPLSKLLGWPLTLRGVTGRLARGGAERNPRRTAGTASALLVGVGVVCTFTVLGASLSSSIEDTVDRAFVGDLVVETAGFSGAGLDPGFGAEVARLPEVAAVATLGYGLVLIDGDELEVTISEPAALAGVADLDVVDGDLRAVGPDGIAISSVFADERGWQRGTVVPFVFADGEDVPVRVDVVYADRRALGDVVLPSPTWAAHALQATTAAALIDLAPGVGVGDGQRAVEAVATRYGSPDVLDRDEFVASEAGEIDQVLTLVYGLMAVAIVIALLGIAGTLSLSIHERTRELGLLRAVGLDRRQLRRIVRGEAIVVSLLGTVGGLGVGTFVGWGLVRAADADEGFGTFTLPVGSLAVLLGLGALAGVVAAVRPARRAARLPVLAALAG